MAEADEDAYSMFHELYFHRLLRYLLVVTGGQEEAAREALQLALLRVVRHIRRFDLEEAFWCWPAARSWTSNASVIVTSLSSTGSPGANRSSPRSTRTPTRDWRSYWPRIWTCYRRPNAS